MQLTIGRHTAFYAASCLLRSCICPALGAKLSDCLFLLLSHCVTFLTGVKCFICVACLYLFVGRCFVGCTISKKRRCTSQPEFQCFFSCRKIGEITLKTIYFHYLKKRFLDESIQRVFNIMLITEALPSSLFSCAAWPESLVGVKCFISYQCFLFSRNIG